MNIADFTNRYTVNRTLRFSLIPQGATLKNLELGKILESDKKRADAYSKAKQILDRMHKAYIEKTLTGFAFSEEELKQIAEAYWAGKTDGFAKYQAEAMKSISKCLCAKENGYKELFSKDKFNKTIAAYANGDEEKQTAEIFQNFYTYFTGYNKNRENLYTGEGKSTEIAYRIIIDNLPRFLDNIRTWKKICAILPQETIAEVEKNMKDAFGVCLDDVFSVGFFNRVLTQSGIDAYNQCLGGYTKESDIKIQGLNEKINLYNQQNKTNVPSFGCLRKQMLSDRETLSFIPEMFTNDAEMIAAVRESLNRMQPFAEELHELLNRLADFDRAHIYIARGRDLQLIANCTYGYGLNMEEIIPDDSKKSKKESVSPKSLSIDQIEQKVSQYAEDMAAVSIAGKLAERNEVRYSEMMWQYEAASEVLHGEYTEKNAILSDDGTIQILRGLLESIKDYQRFSALLRGTGNEAEKDMAFYAQYDDLLGKTFSEMDLLFDRVRNYVTQKPFSTDKFRLMFDKSDFLGGWAQKEEWSKQEAHLFERNGRHYIFVTSRTLKEREWKDCLNLDVDEAPAIHWTYAFQNIDNKNVPRMFIRSKGANIAPAVKKYDLPIQEVIDIYDKGCFKKEFGKQNPELFRKSLAQLIDYFKMGISLNEATRSFDLESHWKPTAEYADIGEFYHDTQCACYELGKETVNFNGLLSMVECGMGYLFEIYSKDFSEYSHGSPNLHTIYFKAIFDESTAGNIRLQGGAQIFMRPASLNVRDTAHHPANVPLKNKNPLNPKKTSTFAYELIKDRRYTYDHFELHMPIALNFKASAENAKTLQKRLNDDVNRALCNSDQLYIIGIDRGERNLLYYSVIDRDGRIVEQDSLNVIADQQDGVTHQADYHAMLGAKEEKRLNARREWRTIEGIKNLKEGYLSQAVHKICQLVEKYNAIIVMENLNAGFKNARSAVEKSVYQKFEKMLCDKLSFWVNKQKQANESGGVLNAYQLAMPTTSYNDMRGQNGIIFYVPAWLTSKIDPTTGFADMIHSKYVSVEAAKAMISTFKGIRFNESENLFEFAVDYGKLDRSKSSHIQEWTICTHGDRIETRRNRNDQWESRNVYPTEMFAQLFKDYGIDYRQCDLKKAILQRTEKKFFEDFMRYLRLTLQMRNSKTGTAEDYLISPVRNAAGIFFDSRRANAAQPRDADANGAYNIARKGLWTVNSIKVDDDKLSVNLKMDNKQWLEYAQKNVLEMG